MANLCVAKILSRVKGHHVYQYNCTVGKDFSCEMEPSNIYSKNAIAVKEKSSNKIVGHIPEPLSKILYSLMKSWKVYEITCTITGQSKKAPEGTWVLGGRIEFPCRYFLYGPKIRKREVRKCIKDKYEINER